MRTTINTTHIGARIDQPLRNEGTHIHLSCCSRGARVDQACPSGDARVYQNHHIRNRLQHPRDGAMATTIANASTHRSRRVDSPINHLLQTKHALDLACCHRFVNTAI
jgi:hypothetical protein